MSAKSQTVGTTLVLLALCLPPTGCKSWPGTARSQGAVIGGVAGALGGAAIAKNNRLLGALIGAALGAGGGYLIGAAVENTDGDEEDRRKAAEAARKAAENPARASDVAKATTADLNSDGFVTMDEVVAMENAGLTDDEMIARLKATGQLFELTIEQEDYLRGQGVSSHVIAEMERIDEAEKESIIERRTEVIGRPRS